MLVVEDSAEDFDTVREAARRMGIKNELIHATDVDSARDLLEASVAGSRGFAFVLLDQSLPGTNGDGLLREIRTCAGLSLMPVIMLSGSTRQADCNKCYGAGANAYHVKPVRFDEYLETVKGIFRYWLSSAVLPDSRPSLRRD